MAHKCFISFKKEDMNYKNELVKKFNIIDVIDNSLDRKIESENGDYIMSTIRQDYLNDSTVTIFLIGEHSSEEEGNDYFGRDRNYFIKKELQATLYNGTGNTRSGLLGVVLPNMYERIFKGSLFCSECNKNHNIVALNDSNIIREFSKNYYLEPHKGCAWNKNERFCVLVKWDYFIQQPEKYIEEAFQKRDSDIANKVRIYKLR